MVESTSMQSHHNNNAKSVEEINAFMVKFAPELQSSYAQYPLNRDRWYEPTETDLNGEPCYIPFGAVGGGGGGQRKRDYVFGNGSCGIGYYNLLTKDSYNILYQKVSHMKPPNDCCYCCVFSQRVRKEYNDWEDLKRILYKRMVSTLPNDQ